MNIRGLRSQQKTHHRILLSLSLFVFFTVSCAEQKLREVHDKSWETSDGYRFAELPRIKDGDPGFKQLSAGITGIDFENHLSDSSIVKNRNLLNGSGVAIADITGNGFPDIYFTRLDGSNVLYENLGGWQFRDITDKAGLALPNQYSTGAVFADLNGNGLKDLVVTSNDASNKVFVNNGDATFTEKKGALATSRNYGSTSIGIADLNGNGALDIYISNYKERSVRDIYPYENRFRNIVKEVDGEFEVREQFADHYRLDFRDTFLIWFETGEPDLLFLNNGDGSFEKADITSGILKDERGEPITEPLLDWGLHVKITDINNNGLPDIYVANDFETPDRIWLNQGDGTFRALPRLAKRKSSLSSMAVDFSDINRNGYLDYFVVEMLSRSHVMRHRQMGTMAPSPQPIGAVENRPQYLGNTLFLNRGDQTYAEISEFAGVRRSEWSWSTLFLDMTLDGYEDILVTTGHYLDVQDSDANNRMQQLISMGRLDQAESMLIYPQLENQNVIFQNNHDLTFTDKSDEWGFQGKDISHGMALADLDGDGIPDLVVNKLGSPAGVYKNTVSGSRIAVRLKGESPNTEAIGSKIYVDADHIPKQQKQVISGGAYLSGSDTQYVFATLDDEKPVTIRVVWPDGQESTIKDAMPNHIYEIDQTEIETTRKKEEEISEEHSPYFSDISGELGAEHKQTKFNDMERQPLLPWRLSQPGPALSWLDVNGNQSPELIITQGEGHAVTIKQNTGDGQFRDYHASELEVTSESTQNEITPLPSISGEPGFLISQSNYRDGSQERPSARLFRLRDGELRLTHEFPGGAAEAGPAAFADYTGNGYPDLFLGSRTYPGFYPFPPSSRLFVQDENGWSKDEENSEVLENTGIITDAVFSDIDGDGTPELILSEFWGSPRVFKTDNGEFREVTAKYGLEEYKGWWNTVTTADVNGNGRLDIIAGNWGTNHLYKATPDQPNYLYYGDFTGDNTPELLEAYYDDEVGGIVPRRGLSVLAEHVPHIKNRVRTYETYSVSTLEEIIGPEIQQARRFEAGYLKHTVFINTGSGFEARPLPEKAQFAPVFDIAAADLTGNGYEDLYLAQNFFAYHLETPRSDAGRSLLLENDGSGNFRATPGKQSGLKVYGEQRSIALGDINQNGRVDVAIGQNANQVKLFRNDYAERGLKVTLQPQLNEHTIAGTRIRPIYRDDTSGPVREVRSHYGSFSAELIFGRKNEIQAFEVTWPDNTTMRQPVEGQPDEIIINKETGIVEK